MGLPKEYLEYLRQNVNALEKLGEKFSGTDERVDYVVRQQAQILRGIQEILQEIPGAEVIPPEEWPKRQIVYGGAVYVNKDTAIDNTVRRFETTSKKLRDVIIIVKTQPQLFGHDSSQTYPVGVDEAIGITQIDISTLYFKNATAGQNGTVHILAVED